MIGSATKWRGFGTVLLALAGCAVEGGPHRPAAAAPGELTEQARDGAVGGDARAAANQSSDGGGAAQASGLPCAVSELLRGHCQVCHADPPRAAPIPLVTHEQLLRAAPSDMSRSVAEVALTRMQQGTMPPSGPLVPAAALASFASWVGAGMPREICDGELPPPDAGTATPGPFDTPTRCSSGDMWEEKDEEGPQMRPGGPCLACHRANDGPSFTIAGTVYPTAHEPENCDGADDSDIRVVITGADGRLLELRVNSAGNFYTEQRVMLPYTAKVTIDGRERAMPIPQSSGDCNSCHTERGASGAPGRVMLP